MCKKKMWLYVIGATVLTGIGLVIIYLYNVNYPVEPPLGRSASKVGA